LDCRRDEESLARLGLEFCLVDGIACCVELDDRRSLWLRITGDLSIVDG
jgi:hypothetical protein